MSSALNVKREGNYRVMGLVRLTGRAGYALVRSSSVLACMLSFCHHADMEMGSASTQFVGECLQMKVRLPQNIRILVANAAPPSESSTGQTCPPHIASDCHFLQGQRY